MKRLRWPGRDNRSMVRTVASCRMTLMRLAMGSVLMTFCPHHIHTQYVFVQNDISGGCATQKWRTCPSAGQSRESERRGYVNPSPERTRGVAVVRQQTLGSQPLAYARGSDWRPHRFTSMSHTRQRQQPSLPQGGCRAILFGATGDGGAVLMSVIIRRDAALLCGRDSGWWGTVAGDAGDRKSTRLNSSHLGISYAV